jgi:cob(I)alamin adenosyltransferase
MKVYTRTGDKGNYSAYWWKAGFKNASPNRSLWYVDELMAFTGVLHDQAPDTFKPFLLEILDRLMTCASILAADCEDCEIKLPQIEDKDILGLENKIDEMDKTLKPLSYFVLPAGHIAISSCHVCRTVCRRCERLAIEVNENEGPCEMVIKYLNRLSDYFFVLSRKFACELNVNEIMWVPRT